MTSLRVKMKQDMELRGFAKGTQQHYLQSVIQLYKHYQRSPAKLSEQEIKNYLLQMGSKSLSASTYNVRIHGLRFFYDIVLSKPIITSILLPRKRERQKLPDILSPCEIEKIIKATSNIKHRALLIITYGAGLRVSEVAKLKVGDIDSKRMVLHIRDAKRGKDRYTVLSDVMLQSLRNYWRTCRSKIKNNLTTEFVFLNQLGKPLSPATCAAIYKSAKKKPLALPNKGGSMPCVTPLRRMH